MKMERQIVLTCTLVFVECPYPGGVLDERRLSGPVERLGAVGQGPVVHVVQLAVVDLAVGRARVQVGPAKELCFHGARPLAGSGTVGLKMGIK